ncbi:unnamed protein product [Gadus morhua 'NCC']
MNLLERPSPLSGSEPSGDDVRREEDEAMLKTTAGQPSIKLCNQPLPQLPLGYDQQLAALPETLRAPSLQGYIVCDT